MKFYTDRLIMTPGPTEIPLRVKKAMIRETTNPDLDPSFLELYNNVRGKLQKLLNAEKSHIYVMAGEAIMGLEASIANTMKPGDKVIVVANGVFGEGFADIVKAYGGKPLLIAGENWRGGVDVGEVERALEKNRDASILTIVHCDTPSAILNDVRSVAKIARDFGVITIVDAVSTIGGVPVEFDNWGLDILIGGSQKVLNAPPGLTVIALSDDVWERVERVNYTGLYMSFKLWRDMLDVKNVFPYTMPDVLVYALDEALNIILEEGLEQVYSRHLKAREASWRALETLNLEPYPSSLEHSSPTVSAIIVPQSVSERKLRDYIWVKYGVLLAGSWGRLEGKVIRVGHMGLQASRTHLLKAYTALARGLKDMGLEVSVSKVVDAIENAYT
ncbi:MAG: alanine--glyoxylate aminotransferase family protein [Desulfurococcales archaeon]|nr:alanine--glyoxylate aminotransferase family protein [Desulfurococcales archaeon]